MITAKTRDRFGPVHILDPFGVTGLPSSAFNPLGRLDPEHPDAMEDANALAEALVQEAPGETGEAHWNEEAKALLSGLILQIAAAEPSERRNLSTLREYLTLAPDAFSGLLKRMQQSPEAHGLIARAANRHLGKADREAAGVLSTAQRHTHFLDSPRMGAVLSRSDFAFADLKHRTTRSGIFTRRPSCSSSRDHDPSSPGSSGTMPIGNLRGWRETHYRTRSIGYGRQIRLSEVAPLEEDRHLIGLGAGIGEAIGQVKLGGMSPALAVTLEGLNREPADLIRDRHDLNARFLQNSVEISLGGTRHPAKPRRQHHRGFKAHQRRRKFRLGPFDRPGKSLRLFLLAEDGHKHRCVDKHQRVHIASRSASVTGRASGPV